jgi:hypothetical protein
MTGEGLTGKGRIEDPKKVQQRVRNIPGRRFQMEPEEGSFQSRTCKSRGQMWCVCVLCAYGFFLNEWRTVESSGHVL